MKSPKEARLDTITGAFQALMTTPGWDTYVEELGNMELRTLESMVQSSKENFDYYKGFIEGLRAAVQLPQRYKRS